MGLFRKCGIVFGIALIAGASSAMSAPIVISGNGNGWTMTDGVGWSHAFVSGPAGQPLGSGSLNFVENTSDGSDAGQAKFSGVDGKPLAVLNDLSYSTYVTTWNGQQAPWVRVFVDLDNNGSTDEELAFEPDYQFVSPSNTSPAAATGVWQTWDTTTNHGWYADDGINYTFGTPGDITTGNLSDYIVSHPGAKIATDNANGSFRIRSGFTGPGDNFDTNIDAVTLDTMTFDFDPAAAVPSPASVWGGMMLIGVLGVSTYVRRRRLA